MVLGAHVLLEIIFKLLFGELRLDVLNGIATTTELVQIEVRYALDLLLLPVGRHEHAWVMDVVIPHRNQPIFQLLRTGQILANRRKLVALEPLIA